MWLKIQLIFKNVIFGMVFEIHLVHPMPLISTILSEGIHPYKWPSNLYLYIYIFPFNNWTFLTVMRCLLMTYQNIFSYNLNPEITLNNSAPYFTFLFRCLTAIMSLYSLLQIHHLQCHQLFLLSFSFQVSHHFSCSSLDMFQSVSPSESTLFRSGCNFLGIT